MQLGSDVQCTVSLLYSGSRLTIPCKVFLGAGTHSTTVLWWMVNNSNIESAYQEGRVTEGQRL